MLPSRNRFRKWPNYLLACASEVVGPVLRTAARLRARRAPSDPQTWRRGVLLGADHIGDVLYNTASLPALKQGLPNCGWSYVASAPASEVLIGNPNIKEILSRDQFRAMPRGSFDVAVCYNSGANWPDLLLAVKAAVPNLVGYADKGFSSVITHPVRINYPQPYPAYFRDLVAQVTDQSPAKSLRPRIYPSSLDSEKADAVWTAARLGEKPVVACFLTSRQAAGVWPARKFAEVVALLEATNLCQTVLCGTATDETLLEALKKEFGLRAKRLTGTLDLRSLGCFIQKCAVVLCPDSGPRHLANAVQTPVVFVRNFAVGKIETGAYCETESDAAPDFQCVSSNDEEFAFDQLRPEYVADVVRQRGALAREFSAKPNP